MEWIIKPCRCKSQYWDGDTLVEVSEPSFECTCSFCGWKTGEQGKEFQYCPMCGEPNGSEHGDEELAKLKGRNAWLRKLLDLATDTIREHGIGQEVIDKLYEETIKNR